MRAAASFVEKNPAEAVALRRESQADFHLLHGRISARGCFGEYVWTTTGRIQDDLERYFQILIDAGRMPATTPPRELVRRVYRGASITIRWRPESRLGCRHLVSGRSFLVASFASLAAVSQAS